ncbi:hypothetical protein FB451DRAFT_1192266 [Mycena latifolia]|nr:hypothetical protein FB451DRAFT_1192266 [Mycena latifolia]
MPPQSLAPGLHDPRINRRHSALPRPQSPQINRRHSASLTPRPLRSSPLAGSAFSSDDGQWTTVEGNGAKGHPRGAVSAPSSRSPSLLSLPDFASENLPFPSRSHRDSKVAFMVPAIHPSLSPSLDDSAPIAGPSKHPWKRHSAQPIVPILVDARSEDHGPEGLPTSGVSPSSTRPGSRASLLEPGENWLTTAPYATTPRFSRLGLAAPGVVMPVRKGSLRPKSADGGSVRSLGGSVRSLGSVPSLSRTRSSSVSSSAQSLRLPSTPSPAPALQLYESTKDYELGIRDLGKARETVDAADALEERDGSHRGASKIDGYILQCGVDRWGKRIQWFRLVGRAKKLRTRKFYDSLAHQLGFSTSTVTSQKMLEAAGNSGGDGEILKLASLVHDPNFGDSNLKIPTVSFPGPESGSLTRTAQHAIFEGTISLALALRPTLDALRT